MTKGITLQELDESTKSRLVIKDSAGRAKVTAPSAADDIAVKSTVDNAIGNLSTLQTTDKSNVVKAINELFTNVGNGKDAVAAAITGKGVQASGSDTFAQLVAKIGQIVTGSRTAQGTITGLIMNNDSNYVFNLTTQPLVTGLEFKPSKVFLRLLYTSNEAGPVVLSPNAFYDLCFGSFPESWVQSIGIYGRLFNENEGGFSTNNDIPGRTQGYPAAIVNVEFSQGQFKIVNMRQFTQHTTNTNRNAQCKIEWLALE